MGRVIPSASKRFGEPSRITIDNLPNQLSLPNSSKYQIETLEHLNDTLKSLHTAAATIQCNETNRSYGL